MLKAHNIDGMWVWAKDYQRGIPYFCPECSEAVHYVSGHGGAQEHFRHNRESSCGYGSQESIAHEMKKQSIFDSLSSILGEKNVWLESRLDDGQRPDVSFLSGDKVVAVEIQYSQISDVLLAERVASYSDKNIPSLWLIGGLKNHINAIPADLFGGARDRLPAWVRRIAGMYNNIGMDQASDTHDLVNVNLVPQFRTVKQGGQWVYEIHWQKASSNMLDGEVKAIHDSHGWPQLLWVPRPQGKDGNLRRGEKHQRQRREIPDNMPYQVDCSRVDQKRRFVMPVSVSLEEIEQQMDANIAAYMSNLERTRANAWIELQRQKSLHGG